MSLTVLVTGGAGFIGSHVADALLAAGHRVLVIDDLSTGRREFVPAAAEFLAADIASPEAAQFVAHHRPDVAFHLAAKVSVRESVEDPARDAQTNVLGSLALLEACRRAGVGRFLFASTGGAMYGLARYFPSSETDPATPISPYGCAKRAVEGYLGYYSHSHRMRCCAMRFANVYGPRQSPDGEAGVVAIFADRLLQGVRPTIHGDGSQTRDYVYVEDVAAAMLAALTAGLEGTFNVGTGRETSVLDVFRGICAAARSSLDAVHGPERTGDAARSALDASALASACGWKPQVSLPVGLERTVSWFRAGTPSLKPLPVATSVAFPNLL